jgi:hypothetical protein
MHGSGAIQLDQPERKMEATNDWEIFYRRTQVPATFAKVISFQVLLSIVTSRGGRRGAAAPLEC